MLCANFLKYGDSALLFTAASFVYCRAPGYCSLTGHGMNTSTVLVPVLAEDLRAKKQRPVRGAADLRNRHLIGHVHDDFGAVGSAHVSTVVTVLRADRVALHQEHLSRPCSNCCTSLDGNGRIGTRRHLARGGCCRKRMRLPLEWRGLCWCAGCHERRPGPSFRHLRRNRYCRNALVGFSAAHTPDPIVRLSIRGLHDGRVVDALNFLSRHFFLQSRRGSPLRRLVPEQRSVLSHA